MHVICRQLPVKVKNPRNANIFIYLTQLNFKLQWLDRDGLSTYETGEKWGGTVDIFNEQLKFYHWYSYMYEEGQQIYWIHSLNSTISTQIGMRRNRRFCRLQIYCSSNLFLYLLISVFLRFSESDIAIVNARNVRRDKVGGMPTV